MLNNEVKQYIEDLYLTGSYNQRKLHQIVKCKFEHVSQIEVLSYIRSSDLVSKKPAQISWNKGFDKTNNSILQRFSVQAKQRALSVC